MYDNQSLFYHNQNFRKKNRAKNKRNVIKSRQPYFSKLKLFLKNINVYAHYLFNLIIML